MNAVSQNISRRFNHAMEVKPKTTCFHVDEQGRETVITPAMVMSVCQQLLHKCRSAKA